MGRRRFVTLDSRLLDLNSTEQSENVIENKGSSWKTRLFFGIFEHGRTYDKDDQSEIPRAVPFKVCHSERSEESALVRPGPELQLLRFAQDDSEGLRMTLGSFRVTPAVLHADFEGSQPPRLK